MAITHVSSTVDHYNSATSVNQRTVAVDIGTRTNGLLVVGIATFVAGSDPDVTSVTYGGQALAKATDDLLTVSTSRYLSEIWYLANPPNGNNNLVVNFAATNITRVQILPSWYDGANQTQANVLSTVNQGNGSTDPSLALQPGENDCLVVSQFYSETNNPLTVSNHTQLQQFDFGPQNSGGGYAIQTTATNVTYGWAGVDADWTMVVASFKAAAAGGGATHTETSGAYAPGQVGGSDAAVWGEASGAVAAGAAGGTDSAVFAEGGQASGPAADGGADQAIWQETAGAQGGAWAGGASQLIARGREGGAEAPALAGGADATTFTEAAAGGASASGGGTDGAVWSETSTAQAAAALGGLDSAVWTETGGGAAGASAGGTATLSSAPGVTVYAKTGGVAAGALAGGSDQAIWGEAAGVRAPGLGAGFDGFVSSHTGGAVAVAVISGAEAAASGPRWVPADGWPADADVHISYGEGIDLRRAREQARAALDDDEILLLLL